MKKISKYFLPRLTWFHLYFGQWFKNIDGIKGFAQQVMNWLMRETLGLAANLRKANNQLGEDIKNCKNQLEKRLALPMIAPDELRGVKSKMRSYSLYILIAILAEFGFNFYATRVLLPMKGWAPLIMQIIMAAFITFGFVKLFEQLFTQIFNEPKYKTDVRPKRHIGKMVFFIIMASVYEFGVYYLCRVRGISIEGGHGLGDVTIVAMIFGMIAPIIAGYYGYERNRFKDAYNNTVQINKLEKSIADKNKTIELNKVHMRIHFKQRCQEQWAFLQEFIVYKQNFNSKKDIKESLSGHFCENQEKFTEEAVARYNEEIIYKESETPLKEISTAQQNGHRDLFKNLITQ